MKAFSKKYQKSFLTLTQISIVIFIVYMLFSRLKSSLIKALEVAGSFHWRFVLAVFVFVLAVVISGVLWGRLVRAMDEKAASIPIYEYVRVHLASWLLKYIPGQAGAVVNKAVWAKKHNIPQNKILMTILYENIFLASSSVLLSIPFIGVAILSKLGNSTALLMPIVALIFVVLLLIPKVFEKFISIILKVTKKKVFDLDNQLTGKNLLLNQIYFLLPRIINGFGFVMIVSIFYHPSVVDALQLSAAYILAGILGILAFFVPSGLGVRELVIVLVASPILGAETATVAAILARFCATIADVVIGIIYGGILGYEKRN